MSDSTQEEAHTGPIRTPKQLLLAVFFSFVVPVAIIIGLVAYVATGSKPSGSTRAENYAMGGMTAQDLERGVAERIRKVGSVEIREAARAANRTGEDAFKAQCSACHTAGVSGAPKFGDAGAWANRIGAGFDALLTSALKGKGAMPPQAGGDLADVEIARAVVYMANAGGAKFPEPKGGDAAAAAPAAADAAAAAPAAAAAATAAPAAAAPAATGAVNGEALYKQTCATCHGTGIAGAPKLGDKAAWAPRIQTGLDTLVKNSIAGKNAMPPRGGSAASDAELKAAVEYMVNASK